MSASRRRCLGGAVLVLAGGVSMNSAALASVTLTPVTQAPASNADTGMTPVGVAFSPSGDLLATSDVEGNETAMFGVTDATGALAPIGQTPAGGAFPWGLAFSPSGGLLAEANSTYTQTSETPTLGSVSTFLVNQQSGALTLASTAGAGQQPQGVTFTPNGLFLATANVYSDSVSVYQVDDTTGALTPVVQTPAADADTGTEPWEPEFSPSGGLLAVPNDGSGTVSMFMVNDMTGALTPVTQSPASNADTGTGPWGVAFSPNGGLLAVANTESDDLSIFQVNQTTGQLTPVTQTLATNAATGGSNAVAFNASGSLLATANTGGTVSLFQVNDTTGALTPAATASTGTDSDPDAVAFSPCGGLVATADERPSTVSMFTVGGESAATLALALSPTSIAADGTSTATATATVTSDCGSPDTGQTVTITSSGGQTIGPVTAGATPGTYQATITSTTTGGTATITATDTSVTPNATATATLTQTGGSGGGTGTPVETGAPTITGTADAGHTLTCSTGSWTNDPDHFTYQWYRDGTAIQGATSDTYVVAAGDEQLTLSCSVTASNANGAGASASSAKTAGVPVPKVKKCPAATGALSGSVLGQIRLGMTRAQARHAYTKSSNRGKRYQDFFCLTPVGVRVGYASPALLKTLPKRDRGSLTGRVIWASTASAYYTVRGIRVGATIAAAAKTLKLSAPLKIGLNDWYFAPDGTGTAVLKVRDDLIEEIGIGDKALTQGIRAQRTFMTSFS